MMAKRMSKTPVKVYEATREKIRLAAALKGTIQAEVMEVAVDEYIERHSEDFALGLKHAREALLAGPVSAVAYLLDEDDPEKLRRVGGSDDAPAIRARKAARPTPIAEPE